MAARELNGDDYTVISVIGDGSMTGGMAYEGLNNAGRFKKNFIVVLNDNKMSISRNVGSIARYLKKVRFKPGYLKTKETFEKILNRIPLIGKPIARAIRKMKARLRQGYSNGGT